MPKIPRLLKNIIVITFGAAIIAFGVINFSVTSNLASGGLVGITLILYHMLGLSTGLTTFIFNVPLILIYFRYSSKKEFFLTIYAVAVMSGLLRVFEIVGPILPDLRNDMILAAVGFGACIGIGVGLILKNNGTTGGLVIVAKLLFDKFSIPIAKSMLVSDALIIGASLLLFVTIKDGFYSLIGIFVAMVCLTKVQEGFLAGYKVLIFSDEYEAITQAISTQLQRGATFLNATGAYSKMERKIVMVIVEKKQLTQVKQIVNQIDDHSFVSVSHTYETLGEGFTIAKRLGGDTVDDSKMR